MRHLYLSWRLRLYCLKVLHRWRTNLFLNSSIHFCDRRGPVDFLNTWGAIDLLDRRRPNDLLSKLGLRDVLFGEVCPGGGDVCTYW